MSDAGRYIKILFGGALALLGLGGVPVAALSGSWVKLILFTLCLFAGIGILGKMYKE